jgi:hypothetical protein
MDITLGCLPGKRSLSLRRVAIKEPMNNVLIRVSDKAAYCKIMTDACYHPYILEELQHTIRVNFCSATFTFWVKAGYWHSF